MDSNSSKMLQELLRELEPRLHGLESGYQKYPQQEGERSGNLLDFFYDAHIASTNDLRAVRNHLSDSTDQTSVVLALGLDDILLQCGRVTKAYERLRSNLLQHLHAEAYQTPTKIDSDQQPSWTNEAHGDWVGVSGSHEAEAEESFFDAQSTLEENGDDDSLITNRHHAHPNQRIGSSFEKTQAENSKRTTSLVSRHSPAKQISSRFNPYTRSDRNRRRHRISESQDRAERTHADSPSTQPERLEGSLANADKDRTRAGERHTRPSQPSSDVASTDPVIIPYTYRPDMEYQDITAEVEARLLAKRKARVAAKGQVMGKRKRVGDEGTHTEASPKRTKSELENVELENVELENVELENVE